MIKEIAKHSLIYGIGNVLKNASGFFLLPLYTSYLTVGEYGELEIFIISITVLVRILQLGFGSALFKYYSYDVEESTASSYRQNKILITSSFLFLVLFSLGCITGIALFRESISQLLFQTQEYANLVGVSLGIVFFQLLLIIPLSYLRIQNRSVLYSILNIAQFLVQVGLIIYFVAFLNWKINGVLTGRLVTTILFTLIFIWVIRNELVPRFSLGKIKEMLEYGIYLVPVSISSLVLMMSNRYFILFFRDADEVGIFSVGNKIATILFLGVNAFQVAWPAFMFRIKEYENAKQIYSRVITYYVAVFVFIFLTIQLFSKELVLLLSNPDYLYAMIIIPILSLSYLIYGFFYVGTIGINIYKKTYFQTIAIVIGAVANFGINLWATPQFGIIGTAMTFLFSTTVVSALAVFFSQRIYRISFEWIRIFKILICASGLIGVVYIFFPDMNLMNGVVKGSLLLIGFPFLLLIIGFLNKRERALIPLVNRF
ncbi:MAG: polysaccharide biosynthesis C-terminal domain-containing protein [Candidatus Marinimicrobia bacterium]|nr:polysaccharide biosynthesis C-terminal domain-containing protein [Candidatus Neomarinimicrobiota bacterium]MCF7828558.1 polysaccharide biosynthesis C-terminal domain-containing protein [Candidatus Neomarinimicrobiota bacterium]MCF7880299.1 polysaccharide biosynthesis C-terminal domain-containing protein [Candidatus Neomarinimicrobiota bacterium]